MVLGIELFLALFNNLAIFIALVTIYSFIFSQLREKSKYWIHILNGVSFGLFAIGCMQAKIPVFPGVVVDQRNAIIALSGAFGGPISAFVSMIFAALFRAYLGGQGVKAGIIGLNLAAVAGIILFWWKKSFENVRNAAIGSLIAVIIILPGFLFVEDFITGLNLMKAMALPYGMAIFLGIFLAGFLLKREERRHEADKKYHESEEKYRVLFESFPLGFSIIDKSGNIIEANKISEKILGISVNEHESRNLDDEKWTIINPDGTKMAVEEYAGMRALKENKKIENVEMGVQKSDGSTVWLNVTASLIPLEKYGVAVIYHDVTKRKTMEFELKKALDEKTVLLQELYHRTKNNMQVIISLLDSQARQIDDEKLLNILKETQNRIHSMALVHQKLYQSGDLSHINLKNYIVDLMNWLISSYQIEKDKIKIGYNMQDVFVLIDIAIPCGLILQELISNVFKYAFPDNCEGKITVDLFRKEKEITMKVSDNGIGLNRDFDIDKDSKLGLRTMKTLAEMQLEGNLDIVSNDGLAVKIVFKDNKYFNRL